MTTLDSLVLHVENLKAAGYAGIDQDWAQSFTLVEGGVVGISEVIEWWLSHL